MKAFIAIFFFVITFVSYSSAQKKAISHDDYAAWKTIRKQQISNRGNIITYEINPLRGDGILFIHINNNAIKDSIPRGYNALISPNENFIICKLKAPFDSTRQAKIEKRKKDEMPSDSLCIYYLQSQKIKKFPLLNNYAMAEKNTDFFAFQLKKEFFEIPNDTTKTDSIAPDSMETVKKDKNKSKALPLLIYNPINGDSLYHDYVKSYTIAEESGHIAFISEVKDSLDSVFLYLFNPNKIQTDLILAYEGEINDICFDKQGSQLAIMHSADTTKIKQYQLSLYNLKKEKLQLIVDSSKIANTEEFYLSKNSKIYFCDRGDKLFLPLAPLEQEKPKDSIPEDEKVSLDIWSHTDIDLQSYQLNNIDKERKQTYTAVYDIKKKKLIPLEDKKIENVSYSKKGISNYALGFDDSKYRRSISWEVPMKRDIYLINMQNGEKELILQAHAYNVSLSPSGKFTLYYQISDSSWYCIDNATKKHIALTKDLDVPFYNEKYDMPILPYPYGTSGWAENDDFVFINDAYDIWKIDPKGKNDAVNITNNYGRDNAIRINYIRLDKDEIYISGKEEILLHAFNTKSRAEAYYSTNFEEAKNPEELIRSEHKYRYPIKAKDAEKYIWRRENFQEYPNLRLSNRDFENNTLLSNANPQQKDFQWGNVEMIKWKSYSTHQDTLEGLLYTPENFDPQKKYPTIVYFYERNADNIHYHWIPNPSRSIINPSVYCSNDYVVFIPDITYTTGQPGQDAYDAVISGTEYIKEKYGFIDPNRIGIQGQSWGGYQVAHLVGKTDIYAAAMAGAPVSNMISAYGGIRRKSGVSRAFQYECGQSRIGSSLWEDPKKYIENSPIFFADKVTTPLLIMHNDNDGAVPWEQSIEYFSALRRLDKIVWLLVYNKDEHNLMQWPNRMDLSIRMMQFFDYYLKDAPIPRWMKEGIDAIEKGKELKYELTK